MNKTDITDKDRVLVSRVGDFWISQNQANQIMQIKSKDPTGFVEVDGCLVSCTTFDGVLTAGKYADLNVKRKGGWQCKYDFWHERGQSCSHAEIARIRA